MLISFGSEIAGGLGFREVGQPVIFSVCSGGSELTSSK